MNTPGKRRGQSAKARPAPAINAAAGQLPIAGLSRFRTRLLRWYRANHRSLPWRSSRDPYRIWLSEIMLQQTRVETVLPYYARFLDRFPTVADLASAPLDDVLRLWAGLGYYSRARNLHAAARQVVRDHAGRFPTDHEALGALPGVGRYTAAAVASIAAGEPIAVVDGNVKRVIARLRALVDSIDTPAVVERIWSIAQAMMDPRSPGDFNQAMMELGATICVPRNPACADCPVNRDCLAARDGLQDSLPVRRRKKSSPIVHAVALAIVDRRRILLEKRADSGLLAGLWGLPQLPVDADVEPDSAARQIAASRFDNRLQITGPIGRVEHVFTHRTLRLQIVGARASSRFSPANTQAWGRLDGADGLARSTLDEKCLAVVRGDSRGQKPSARTASRPQSPFGIELPPP
ncbi:MAG: A/G-specific adenine glycosylase [Planctomycetota bacterium]